MRVEHLDTPVARIGREIRRLCDEKNYTYKQVADMCNESLRVLYPKDPRACSKRISEDRVGKIVEAYQKPSAAGVAVKIDGYELAAIPHALKFSLDEALGTNFKQCALVWDPFADPDYSERLLKLLRKHGENAHELIGWSECLPCSMETSEFMQAHHRQLFCRQPGLSYKDWRQLMDHYNLIGERRRQIGDRPQHDVTAVAARGAGRCRIETKPQSRRAVKRDGIGRIEIVATLQAGHALGAVEMVDDG